LRGRAAARRSPALSPRPARGSPRPRRAAGRPPRGRRRARPPRRRGWRPPWSAGGPRGNGPPRRAARPPADTYRRQRKGACPLTDSWGTSSPVLRRGGVQNATGVPKAVARGQANRHPPYLPYPFVLTHSGSGELTFAETGTVSRTVYTTW